MKKVILIVAAVVGLASTSRAGINVSVGIGVPVPPPLIIGHRPAPIPPVIVAPRVYVPPIRAPRIVTPCPPPIYRGYGRGYYGWHRPDYRSYDRWGGGGGRGRYDHRSQWNGHRRW